jgi:hypothetical protein
MIHINAVYSLIEQEDSKGDRTTFSFKYVTLSGGEEISCNKAKCTSSNFERRTINVTMIDSDEKRTLRNVLITEFNEHEVIL